MKKRFWVPIIAIVVVLLITIIALYRTWQENPKEVNILQETRFLMDTVVTVQVYATQPEQAIEAAFTRMEKLIRLANRFNPESDVYRINSQAGQGPITVNEEVFFIIEQAYNWGLELEGVFTVLITPLIDLWGFTANEPAVPDSREIERVLPKVNLDALRIYPEFQAVEIPQGHALDLGGVAKGYIVDAGLKTLKEMGVEAAYINAGGDISVLGPKPDGTPWRIGIRDPRLTDRKEHLRDYVVLLKEDSIVTSGDYERYFVEDDVRFHHIIDPRDGYPAQGLKSATVLGPSGLVADILSTAVFILGSEAGLKLIEEVTMYEALFVTERGEVIITSGFNKYLP